MPMLYMPWYQVVSTLYLHEDVVGSDNAISKKVNPVQHTSLSNIGFEFFF